MILNKKYFNVNLALIILITNFYIFTFISRMIENIYIGGIALEGFLRLLFLILISMVMLANLKYYKKIFIKDKSVHIISLIFMILFLLQITIVNNKLLHIQGSIKYFLYFQLILVSAYSCYYHSEHVSKSLLNLSIILFFSIFLVYPFLIYQSGLGMSERLMIGKQATIKLPFWGGNEDAHFMVVLLPFILMKFSKKKLISISILLLLLIFLFYNGTRSAIISFFLVTFLYFYLTSNNKFYGYLVFIISLIIIVGFFQITSIFFASEMGIFNNPDNLLIGTHVGGNFSGRIVYTWIPAIKYTIANSPILGFGSKGYNFVAENQGIFLRGKIHSPHNFFVWIVTTLGITGLLLYIAIIYKLIRISIKSIKKSINLKMKRIWTSILCSWIAFILWSLIANSHGTHGWTIFIILTLLTIANKYISLSYNKINNSNYHSKPIYKKI